MINVYLTDNITQRQFKGADEYGTPSTPTDVARRARVDYRNRMVTNLEGRNVISMAKILLSPLTIIRSSLAARVAATIAYEDKFVFDGVEHSILRIAKAKDWRTRFLEVYVA